MAVGPAGPVNVDFRDCLDGSAYLPRLNFSFALGHVLVVSRDQQHAPPGIRINRRNAISNIQQVNGSFRQIGL